MSSTGSIAPRTGYSGGSGSFYSSSEDSEPQDQNNFFNNNQDFDVDSLLKSLARGKSKSSSSAHANHKMSTKITNLNNITQTNINQQQIELDNTKLSEEEKISLNQQEFAMDITSDNSVASIAKVNIINNITNNYLKYVMLLCVGTVIVALFAFFILSAINGF